MRCSIFYLLFSSCVSAYILPLRFQPWNVLRKVTNISGKVCSIVLNNGMETWCDIQRTLIDEINATAMGSIPCEHGFVFSCDTKNKMIESELVSSSSIETISTNGSNSTPYDIRTNDSWTPSNKERTVANKVGKAFLISHFKQYFKLENVSMNEDLSMGYVAFQIRDTFTYNDDNALHAFMMVAVAGQAAEAVLCDKEPESMFRGTPYEDAFYMLSFYRNKLKLLQKLLQEEKKISGEIFDIYTSQEYTHPHN